MDSLGFFAKICAFQQGLSKAAGWGDGLWSEALAYRQHSWIHSPPTCPSLTPSSSWAPVFNPPGSPGSTCLIETVSYAFSLLFMPSFFNLHSSCISFYYKVAKEYGVPFLQKCTWLLTLVINYASFIVLLWKKGKSALKTIFRSSWKIHSLIFLQGLKKLIPFALKILLFNLYHNHFDMFQLNKFSGSLRLMFFPSNCLTWLLSQNKITFFKPPCFVLFLQN